MRRKTFQVGILWRLIIALILALCLVPISSNPVVALSVGDYFSYSYEVELSKTEIEGSEVFNATITAEATCTNDFPVPASEALITGRIIAEHQASGTEVTLNSSYTVTISPFPSQEGETTQSTVVVALQFPQGSESGTYSVVGELIEAKVKVIIIGWIDVTSYLPSSQTVGSVTYVSASAGNGGGGGGGGAGGGGGLPGVTNVYDFVTTEGKFTKDVTAKSEDSKVELTISKNTIGKKKGGQPLRTITIIEMEEPSAPPENSEIIDLTYDLSPDGATFDPPIILTFTYDPDDIPEGVTEENLIIALWDEEAGEWVNLVATVDPETNTITAKVSHFTAFTVIAYTRPAAFTLSDLSITPAEVNIGGSVAISVLITNTGDLTGSQAVTLKINGAVVETRTVEVSGGYSEKVSFGITADTARTYTVNVDGLSGTFVVKAAPAPTPPAPAPAPTPTPSVPPVVPPVIPPKPINWWLIGGIIASCTIIGVLISQVVRRRQA